MQMRYFDVYNGFAAIGGISLMIFCFAAIVMLQCEAGNATRYRVVFEPYLNLLLSIVHSVQSFCQIGSELQKTRVARTSLLGNEIEKTTYVASVVALT
jgi:hypothetical protein